MKIKRGRGTAGMTPCELWNAGQFVEAFARSNDPCRNKFRRQENQALTPLHPQIPHTMSRAELLAALARRKELGLYEPGDEHKYNIHDNCDPKTCWWLKWKAKQNAVSPN
jgi:hypothetical protein